MELKASSLKWALRHVGKDGDTDLFPMPFEFSIIKKNSAAVVNELSGIHINGYAWQGVRRLIVPKSEFAFRSVCQLDPLDSILFAAIIKEIGTKIEKRRSSVDAQQVFSYRFDPLPDGQLYSATSGWEAFWSKSRSLCNEFSTVLVTDISDHYNQIYHHTLENQLDLCSLDKAYWHAIKNLLANVTEGVSRGVPVGPHPAHLLAELAMVPVDEFLDSLGVRWCRYVDDIHIFCDSRDEGHAILYKFVEYLDKTQKMQINKQKTKIFKSSAFWQTCDANKVDHPISPLELEMLVAVRTYTTSPYQRVRISKITPEDSAKLSKQNIEKVLRDYISAENVDYTRLRWFIRRLTQVGAPGGIEFIVKNFEDFLPAVAEVGNYFEASSQNYQGNWKDIGEALITVYDHGIVKASEYLQVVILSLFARIGDLNHVNKLTKMYSNSSAMCQRKILLAAARAGASSWLSTLRAEYKNSDPWKRRAAIYSMRALPDDERTFWLKAVKKRVVGLDKLIANFVA
ncbi:RNA-directed DNA polymerase [Rhizobium laguerreae]|uniref:RNA-directed DNA polymerase n=1 Tax=Rhizobium laguerreae TaxID=1076926 RepID=UPI001478B40C|nr:RNA-directed DNA polymerase [Rhizobium laguerreae]NNH85780.1 RNA-directed DNA polymerase [Rhizobium laguerreae]